MRIRRSVRQSNALLRLRTDRRPVPWACAVIRGLRTVREAESKSVHIYIPHLCSLQPSRPALDDVDLDYLDENEADTTKGAWGVRGLHARAHTVHSPLNRIRILCHCVRARGMWIDRVGHCLGWDCPLAQAKLKYLHCMEGTTPLSWQQCVLFLRPHGCR